MICTAALAAKERRSLSSGGAPSNMIDAHRRSQRAQPSAPLAELREGNAPFRLRRRDTEVKIFARGGATSAASGCAMVHLKAVANTRWRFSAESRRASSGAGGSRVISYWPLVLG